jgi:hypothetical protein
LSHLDTLIIEEENDNIMKLELKHLAPYLPYDLQIFVPAHIGEHILDMTTEEEIKTMGVVSMMVMTNGSQNYKPILRPPSDFSGKRTAGEVRIELDCSLDCVYEIWDLAGNDKSLEKISYETILVMCKNHIDFQGLIDKGLAIPKEAK